MYVLSELDMASEQMQNDLFTVSVQKHRRELRESNFFLYTVSHQRSSSQFPSLRKAHAVCFNSCIPLIVKQSRDLDGKKLIVIPEASHSFSYIFAVAADIRPLTSPEDSAVCTFLTPTT